MTTTEAGRAAVERLNENQIKFMDDLVVERGGLGHRAAWTRAKVHMATLEAENERLRRDNELVRGAMKAQDEREANAGKRCGVPYELAGCDWPDAVAEEVLALRADVERLTFDGTGVLQPIHNEATREQTIRDAIAARAIGYAGRQQEPPK